MITLNASGSSVTFTFDGNSTYLNDGTITVPKNSLALIADESDMVTFRKSASNDIFVSANIAEFGMTKDELIAWYKANMVSSGGGGGGGVTPSEVQTMIDESISGKMDTSAYTVDASVSSASTNPVQNQVLYDELRFPSESEVETTLIWSGSDWLKTTTNYPSGCTEFKLYCEDISGTVTLGLNDNNGEIGYIVISDLQIAQSSFEEGVVNYTVSGDVMTIFYPTLTNVISLSSGFDLTATVNTIETVYIPLIDQVSANTTAISGKADTSYVDSAVSGKADTDTYSAYTANTTPKVDAAWQEGVKALSMVYDTISGITLSSLPISGGNYNYSSIATDDSLKSDNESVLGVYATGDTYVVSINPIERNNIAHLGVDKKPFNIKMYWNSSYTGNTSHYIAVSCFVNDGTNGYCQWDWKNGEYVPNDRYINTAVTLTYDSTNQVVTITPSSSSALDYIKYVKSNRYIAPSGSLTQEDCRIGLVTIDSNLYKLQEALDNKQDTLSAGTGIEISGNVISATGGGGGEVSSAITSGDTNAVAGGAVFDAVVYSANTYNTELTFDANGYAENWVVGQSAITIDVSEYTSDTRAVYHFENSHGPDLGEAHIFKAIGSWGGQWGNNADNCTITTDGDTATTATITDIPSGTVKVRRTNESNPPKAIISGDTPEIWIKDALDDHRDNTTVHITAAERTAWNAKSDFSGSYNDLTDKPTIPTVPTSNTAFTNDAGYITSGEAQTQIDNSISGKVDTTTYSTYTAATDSRLAEDEEVTARALNNLAEADEVAARALVDLDDRFGGLKLVKLSQQEYDNLQTKDSNTLYVIVN